MNKLIREKKMTIIGSFIGGIGGFLYWRFAGCKNGTCGIKSNPYLMTAYGILLGGVIFSNFKKNK